MSKQHNSGNANKENKTQNKQNQDTAAQNTISQNDGQESGSEKNFLFFYIAIGCLAAGALLFGLAFAIKGAGTYMLIASMFSTLACATFLNAQKRKYDFKAIMPVRIVCYAVMIAALVIFAIGAFTTAK